MPFDINIDYVKTAPNSDHSSASYESGEDSTGTGETGVQVSPPSAVGSHEGYPRSLVDSGEESWVVPDEIHPEDSASRPRTSNHHRHTAEPREEARSYHPSRRQISHERVVTHRPLPHRGPPPPATSSVESSEEWAGHYARGPPPHHGRQYAHWGHAGPAPAPAPVPPPGYAGSYSSGSGYSTYPPPQPMPAAQQLVPFGAPASYNANPYHPAPGGYYGQGHHASPPMGHPLGPHGGAPYGQEMMHQPPGGSYFPYSGQPFPVPVSMAPHMYPYQPVYATPPAAVATPAVVPTPPPPAAGDSSKEKEELAERLANERAAAEKAAEEKFARLEKIMMDERADREAREAAAKKLAEEQIAQAAADQAKAAEIAAAAGAAAAAAKKEAEEKGAEELAKAKAAAEEEKKAAEEAVLATFPAPPPPPEERKKPIKFKDAVGRKFSFPFHLCNTWMGMEDLIRQAFLHVEIIGPHVAEGHYDLVGPNGEIILPQVWETMVEPDWTITMHMWPIPEPPKEELLPDIPPDAIIEVPEAPPTIIGEGEAIPIPPLDEAFGDPPLLVASKKKKKQQSSGWLFGATSKPKAKAKKKG